MKRLFFDILFTFLNGFSLVCFSARRFDKD